MFFFFEGHDVSGISSSTIHLVVLKYKAHPHSAASVSHFLLCCLASLHQQPRSEPSIISLTNTHTASAHHWKPATTTWNGNTVRTKLFCIIIIIGRSPKFHSCCLSLASPYFPTPALCVQYYEEQIFFFLQKGMKGFVSRGERERERSEGQCWGWQQTSLHQPTHPAARQPSQNSTHRSHYCPASSVFTGMLEIVITSVRTEIFNLDVFVEGLWPSCGEARQSQRETDSGTEEERCNRIWTEMRTGSARLCSINTVQIRMLNFCYTH